MSSTKARSLISRFARESTANRPPGETSHRFFHYFSRATMTVARTPTRWTVTTACAWTTAINGNGQQHFQGDTRCILTFLFVLQGKYGQPSHPPRQSGRPPSTATANSIFKVTYVTIHCLSHYLFRSRRRRRQGKHDLLIVF